MESKAKQKKKKKSLHDGADNFTSHMPRSKINSFSVPHHTKHTHLEGIRRSPVVFGVFWPKRAIRIRTSPQVEYPEILV
jgi:hypothetical protein